MAPQSRNTLCSFGRNGKQRQCENCPKQREKNKFFALPISNKLQKSNTQYFWYFQRIHVLFYYYVIARYWSENRKQSADFLPTELHLQSKNKILSCDTSI